MCFICLSFLILPFRQLAASSRETATTTRREFDDFIKDQKNTEKNNSGTGKNNKLTARLMHQLQILRDSLKGIDIQIYIFIHMCLQYIYISRKKQMPTVWHEICIWSFVFRTFIFFFSNILVILP